MGMLAPATTEFAELLRNRHAARDHSPNKTPSGMPQHVRAYGFQADSTKVTVFSIVWERATNKHRQIRSISRRYALECSTLANAMARLKHLNSSQRNRLEMHRLHALSVARSTRSACAHTTEESKVFCQHCEWEAAVSTSLRVHVRASATACQVRTLLWRTAT